MKSKFKSIIFFILFLSLCSIGSAFASQGYYGLFIGVDRYKDSKINGPGTAVADAKNIARIMQKKFGFNVQILTDSKCTKKNIKKRIRRLSSKLKKTDTLIIYFSGKGDIDPLYGYGWWLPYDAVYGDSLTYIDFLKASEIISSIKANVVIITNSRLPDGISDRKVVYSKSNSSGLKFIVNNNNADPVKSKSDSRLSGLGFAFYSALDSVESSDISFFKIIESLKKQALKSGVRISYKNLGGSKIYSGDFILVNKKVKIKEEKVVVNSEPKKAVLSYLSLFTEPKNTDIIINDKIKMKSPLVNKSFSLGKYSIKILKEGYKEKKIKFSLKKDEHKKINISMIKEPPKKGQLYVETSPLKAVISFKDKSFTFSNGMSLTPGEYTLVLSLPFYKLKYVKVIVPDGDKVSIKERLYPINWYKNSLGQKFVRIKSGQFRMGSPENEFMRGQDEISHKVIFSKDFFIMKHEVSIDDWEKFIKETGYKTGAESSGGASVWIGYKWEKDDDYSWKNPGFKQTGGEPVTCINWHDANEFAKWLSKKEGLKYFLPTEAQWEYSCRAGSDGAYAYGNCLSEKEANFAANSKRGNCPVGKMIGKTIITGSLDPNKYGLFDMHGNVMEWCRDWYGIYNLSEKSDPEGPATGKTKVVRGGAWDTDINNCRAANRFDFPQFLARNNIGFRLVLEP